MSLSEEGGVFGREKLFRNSRCQVLCYFAGAVCPGCSHRTPELSGFRNNKFLSHGFGGWESPSQGAERSSLVRVQFLRPHVVAEMREPCGSFYQGTNPFHSGSILMTWSLPMAPPPITNTVGIRSQCMTFEEKSIQSIASCHRWG